MADNHDRQSLNWIFLIGFMGSGKTYWGRRWSSELNLPFYDLDEEICLRERLSIPEIFEQFGEEYFRQAEQSTLHSLLELPVGIISCGGGTPVFFDNLDWMKSHGKVIYLSSETEELIQRLLPEIDHRPLLKNLNTKELHDFIENKLDDRNPFYLQADFILETSQLGDKAPEEIIQISPKGKK